MTTTTNPFTHSAPLSLLGEELDPTPEQKRLARKRYNDLGAWLQEHTSGEVRNIEVYPQGSNALGTTNRDPITGTFDIDLVIRIEYSKTEISQRQLNERADTWLRGYVTDRRRTGGPLAPSSLKKGKRAWTLHYPDGFHMDILPVVPDLEGEITATMGDPSWLADRELYFWQETNPRGFAEWFASVSEAERLRIRERMAEAKAVDVEDLPDDTPVKTTLQLSVQLMKRHRDRYFSNDPNGLAPPSIVITSLASLAYQTLAGSDDLNETTLLAIAEQMPEHIGYVEGQLSILNPTCPDENFADRYKDRPDKAEALVRWLKHITVDLQDIGDTPGPKLSAVLDRAFGEGIGRRVFDRIGSKGQALREGGRVAVTSTGTLTLGQGRSIKPHTFYGDAQT